MIDFWKVLLVEKYNATPGQTCYLGQKSQDIYYYSLFFAICELGLVLVVDLPRVKDTRNLKTDYRLNMHGKIDYCFIDLNQDRIDDRWLKVQFDYIGVHTIDPFMEFNNYTVKDHNSFKTIADTIWCTPEMPLISTSSSGTTGIPKKIVESHRKIYGMSKRMIPRLNFEKSDRVCHIKNIHHGSSLTLFFLPSFMACNYHLTKVWNIFDPNSVDNLVKFCEQEKPNQIFLYTASVLVKFLQSMSVSDRKLELLSLYQITPEIVKLQKEKNVTMIRSTYGETTIGNGILLKDVPKDVDFDSYEINNMGAKFDDFYDLKIENNLLSVSIPSLEQDWKSTGDVFTVLNNNYYFHGRSDLYKLGYSWIELTAFEKEVNTIFGIAEEKANATAVIDSEMQKLYLAVWVDTPGALQKFIEHLHKRYEGLEISYIINDQPYEMFFGARKLDQERIRTYCRNKLNLNI
jgi:hypothetical protein